MKSLNFDPKKQNVNWMLTLLQIFENFELETLYSKSLNQLHNYHFRLKKFLN